MRKQNKGKFHFWSYIGTLGFGRHEYSFLIKNSSKNLSQSIKYDKIVVK
jgi:hypothetical protein